MLMRNHEPIETEPPVHEIQKKPGIGRLLQQIGLNLLALGVLALVGFLAWQRFGPVQATTAPIDPPASPEVVEVDAPGKNSLFSQQNVDFALEPLATPTALLVDGIQRKTNWRTIIPSRPRVEVITYTVQTGDTLFSIAYSFGLKPETILWGNYEVLDDNPHLLKPNQVLQILPTDGVYYEWQSNDDLSAVAKTFKTDVSNILNYPGNHFDLTTIDAQGTGIEPGTWLIIPGGMRAIKDWGPPAITRSNPASARYYGEGACGAVYSGAIGTGTFIWPTTDRSLPGYTYNPGVHPAIDIGGAEGNPIYATDSGVVVYAGWSNYGYGYLIVLDHGNGWQSAYAHLSAVAVTCGQSVYQGGYIGALGNTGNSSGPHLHFELSINGVKVNPLDYVN